MKCMKMAIIDALTTGEDESMEGVWKMNERLASDVDAVYEPQGMNARRS